MKVDDSLSNVSPVTVDPSDVEFIIHNCIFRSISSAFYYAESRGMLFCLWYLDLIDNHRFSELDCKLREFYISFSDENAEIQDSNEEVDSCVRNPVE